MIQNSNKRLIVAIHTKHFTVSLPTLSKQHKLKMTGFWFVTVCVYFIISYWRLRKLVFQVVSSNQFLSKLNTKETQGQKNQVVRQEKENSIGYDASAKAHWTRFGALHSNE